MVFADIGDRVWLDREDSAALTIEGPFAASLAADADNLALRARGRRSRAGRLHLGSTRRCRSPPGWAAARRTPPRL